MKSRILFLLAALSLAGALNAQTPVPEWQETIMQVKNLLPTDPAQASALSAGLLKGKHKKNASLLTALARVYMEAGRAEEAQTYLALAHKADPQDPQLSVLEGDLALAAGEPGRACQLYEQAIYFDPSCCDAYLKYARVYRKGSPVRAEEKLMQLKSAVPGCQEADRELAALYYDTNRFDEAARLYATFADSPLASEDDRLKYAFALYLDHRFDESLAVAERGHRQNDRSVPFCRLMMYNLTDLHRYPEAEQAAGQFCRTAGEEGLSCLDHRYYASLLAAQQKFAPAILHYQAALALDSTQTTLYRDLAEAYEQADDYPQAIASYRTYYASLPATGQNPELLFRLGRLYYGAGTVADTLASPSVADRMAALQQADSLFAQVAEQVPGSYLGDLWRARTHAAMDPETADGAAKPYYEQVVATLLPTEEAKYYPALVECYSYLGYYYLLQGDYLLSKEYWNKILLLDPSNATARKALEGIK